MRYIHTLLRDPKTNSNYSRPKGLFNLKVGFSNTAPAQQYCGPSGAYLAVIRDQAVTSGHCTDIFIHEFSSRSMWQNP